MKKISIKLIQYIIILLTVQTILFFMFQVLPGNPAILRLGIENADNEALKAVLEKNYNLNDNIALSYYNWIKNLLFGDLGNSFTFENYTVKELILPRLLETLKLSIPTIVFSTAVGFTITILLLIKDNKFTAIIKNLVVVGISLPSFWIGIILLNIFGINLGLFRNNSLMLPILSLGIPSTSLIVKYFYLSCLEESKKEYIEFLRINEISLFNITRHIFKNSIISFLGVFLSIFLSILTGSVLIENIFAINGIGKLMVSSIKTYDYPVVQGIVLCYTLIILLCSWIIDLISIIIDKRLKI
ncbi:MAG: ABC transporter permease [Lachnospirales bacterium]